MALLGYHYDFACVRLSLHASFELLQGLLFRNVLLENRLLVQSMVALE